MPVANLATGIALHWHTAFGKQEFFIRQALGQILYLRKMVAGIPVECQPVNSLIISFVSKGEFSPVHQAIFIVIPDIDLHLIHTLPGEARTQILHGKGCLLFHAIQTGVPGFYRHRLILHGERLHINAVAAVFQQVVDNDIGPVGVAFAPQLAATVHIVISFHKRRRTPRRSHQLHVWI